MMPVREPLRSLIYCGAERAVRDVFVDGEQVVVDGCLAHIDLDSALAEVEAIQERGSKNIKNRDWAGRDSILGTHGPVDRSEQKRYSTPGLNN